MQRIDSLAPAYSLINNTNICNTGKIINKF